MSSNSTSSAGGSNDENTTAVNPSNAKDDKVTESQVTEVTGTFCKDDEAAKHSNSTALNEDDEKRLKEAELLKKEGNELYAINDIDGAVVSDLPGQCIFTVSFIEITAQAKYEEALQKAPEASTKQRAVYYANLAACHLKCRQFEDAVQDSTAALELDPDYVKALMRRSAAYEELDDMEHSLADSQKVIELDPDNTLAKNTVLRLTPVVKERQEKMKDEMLGKLKDLGNTLLGKVGLSLDNFKAEKDPNTGSYSINFSQ